MVRILPGRSSFLKCLIHIERWCNSTRKDHMKIELQYPFNQRYKYGYIVKNRENRRIVVLYNTEVDRTSISYARYLISVKLKRFLCDSEHVDHIDDDKTNDAISNLQILSPKQNAKKTRHAISLIFQCPVCNKYFSLTKQKAHKKINPCCSRRCGGIKSHW